MDDKLSLPADGRCSRCGCEELLLAEDFTQYSPLKLKNGRWRREYTSDMEPSGISDPVRIYCPDCPAEYELPKELP